MPPEYNFEYFSRSTKDLINSAAAAFQALDPLDPFIFSLFSFYFLLAGFVYYIRNHQTAQKWFFFIIVFPVVFAKTLNGFLGKKWRIFAKRNYFDRNGAFITIFMSFPLMICSGIILVSYFRTMHRTMAQSIEWRQKFKKRQEQERREAQEDD